MHNTALDGGPTLTTSRMLELHVARHEETRRPHDEQPAERLDDKAIGCASGDAKGRNEKKGRTDDEAASGHEAALRRDDDDRTGGERKAMRRDAIKRQCHGMATTTVPRGARICEEESGIGIPQDACQALRRRPLVQRHPDAVGLRARSTRAPRERASLRCGLLLRVVGLEQPMPAQSCSIVIVRIRICAVEGVAVVATAATAIVLVVA